MLSAELRTLEAESIYIIREAVATTESQVMFYSIGKDSTVLLHLARKALYPAPLPFPLLHIDPGWEFQEMLAFRDALPEKYGCEVWVHQNREGSDLGIHPLDDSAKHTFLMKTVALKQALAERSFQVAFGGARRDEEKSRAKERIFSFRNAQQVWDPKHQRPELWSLYNTLVKPGESLRCFPLSNWTELDVWRYILAEGIDIVPLYLARERPVVEINDGLICVDDDRINDYLPHKPVMRSVRFRTLGCYPTTCAVPSEADSIAKIIAELEQTQVSERHGRVIDRDHGQSMEQKKQEGYF